MSEKKEKIKSYTSIPEDDNSKTFDSLHFFTMSENIYFNRRDELMQFNMWNIIKRREKMRKNWKK